MNTYNCILPYLYEVLCLSIGGNQSPISIQLLKKKEKNSRKAQITYFWKQLSPNQPIWIFLRESRPAKSDHALRYLKSEKKASPLLKVTEKRNTIVKSMTNHTWVCGDLYFWWYRETKTTHSTQPSVQVILRWIFLLIIVPLTSHFDPHHCSSASGIHHLGLLRQISVEQNQFVIIIPWLQKKN